MVAAMRKRTLRWLPLPLLVAAAIAASAAGAGPPPSFEDVQRVSTLRGSVEPAGRISIRTGLFDAGDRRQRLYVTTIRNVPAQCDSGGSKRTDPPQLKVVTRPNGRYFDQEISSYLIGAGREQLVPRSTQFLLRFELRAVVETHRRIRGTLAYVEQDDDPGRCRTGRLHWSVSR